MFDPDICLACGRLLDPALSAFGSLRCQDCRDDHALLRAEAAEHARFVAAVGTLLRLLPPAPEVRLAA